MSNALFEGKTSVMFTDNLANEDGGAIYSTGSIFLRSCDESNSTSRSIILFKSNSTVSFYNNTATSGGAICGLFNSSVLFMGNSRIKFIDNNATSGGAISIVQDGYLTFEHYSAVIFINNRATMHGGAIYSFLRCIVMLNGSSTVSFNSNVALLNGGALYFQEGSQIHFSTSHTVLFYGNTATYGGAVYTDKSNISFEENTTFVFQNNRVLQSGGAMTLGDAAYSIFKRNSTFNFSQNYANSQGGAVYILIAKSMVVILSKSFSFTNNNAKVAGNFVYMFLDASCDSLCLNQKFPYIVDNYTITSPVKIQLLFPTVCVKSSNDKECTTYYLRRIMLGQEISFEVCILDYYSNPAGSVQLQIYYSDADLQGYYLNGSMFHSITSCDRLMGIKIQGNKIIPTAPLNISFSLIYSEPRERNVVTNVVVELSQCHPGFWYNDQVKRCVCFDKNSIVLCQGANSTIKRGYWFGNVLGIPTVTQCPVNYCNFDYLEDVNGYYHLSPHRVNQCRSHRSGIACGSCQKGYTLSFDTADCIHTSKCTAFYTILLVILTILYWIVVVITVFVIMYYKVGIGYLYAITFYYSTMDLLLTRNFYLSNELNSVVRVISSIAKLTPQFLGKMCLVKNMEGVDQEFTHYIHPLAISIILVIISCLARISYKFSALISRGVIHTICCLLLLSYTSIAATSVLLMRPLHFADINKVYTYRSPNTEYFHGRHLPYFIIAVFFTIIIVICLPLLLLLQPFLNRYINFTRIKPILDQFQGCYKDKYRYFAAYYMICRLVIIIISNTTSPEDFIGHYLIIIICIIASFIHQTVRPYAESILNTFDSWMLHLLVLVAVLPIIEQSDSLRLTFVVGFGFALVILPILVCAGVVVVVHRNAFKIPCKTATIHNPIDESRSTDIPMTGDVGMIIDDSTRTNVTVVDM